MDKKRLLDRCYSEQMEEDRKLSEENLKNLKETKDVDAFIEAEAERVRIWNETSQEILDLIEMWKK